MKLIVPIMAAFMSIPAYGEDMASCSDPVGRGYFPEVGLTSKENSGWAEERISGGLTKLTRDGEEYDILFVDSRKEIVSSRQDGGIVIPLAKGIDQFAVLVVYPGKTVEIYTFLKTSSGELEYISTTSRAGNSVPITKSSVMRGTCSYIHFNSL